MIAHLVCRRPIFLPESGGRGGEGKEKAKGEKSWKSSLADLKGLKSAGNLQTGSVSPVCACDVLPPRSCKYLTLPLSMRLL